MTIDSPPIELIDPEITGLDRELLQVFYDACLSEGGTSDEINLRGLHAVLAFKKEQLSNTINTSLPKRRPPEPDFRNRNTFGRVMEALND